MRPARSTVRLAAAVLLALAIDTVATQPRAQNPAATTTAPSGCVLQGQAKLGANVLIYDREKEGRVIARFTGATSPLRVDAFPDRASGRARVVTATGSGGFEISGFAPASQIPLFTKRELPVVEGHLWIGGQREVTVLKGTTSRLEVEKRLTFPLRQSFSAWGPCDAFSLTAGTPLAWDVPGEARGWKAASETVPLFDDWKKDRNEVVTLQNARGMLMWSTRQRGNLVEVQYHGEILLQAWARADDLKALPWGEREDVALPAQRQSGPPRLKLAEVPREVTTTKTVQLRLEPKEKGSVIGVIEPNTPTYVLDVVVGWASVLPVDLHIAPATDGQFWAPASELGLGEPEPKK